MQLSPCPPAGFPGKAGQPQAATAGRGAVGALGGPPRLLGLEGRGSSRLGSRLRLLRLIRTGRAGERAAVRRPGAGLPHTSPGPECRPHGWLQA